MTCLEPIRRLGGDVDDLERMVSDLEGDAQQQEANDIIGRIRALLASADAVISAVLPDGADDLIDDPEAVLRRVRERLGDEPEYRGPALG
jgi:DNA-binding FrmR family transcriptional regulator